MSQSAIEIWTIMVLIWSIVVAICTITFVREWKKRVARYERRMRKLSEKENEIIEREEAFEAKVAELIPFYAKVTYNEEDLAIMGTTIKSVTRKKLAQRLGYRLLEKFNESIYETKAFPPKVKAYEIDIIAKIDSNAHDS